MLFCYPSPKPAMETVMTLKKNPERQIPVSYPSPIVLGTHQDDQQGNCKGLYHYSPPFQPLSTSVFPMSCTNHLKISAILFRKADTWLPTHLPLAQNTCISWFDLPGLTQVRHKHKVNTWASSFLFSSFSSSISKYISVLVMDIVPLMAAPGAISLQEVDNATGPVKSKN